MKRIITLFSAASLCLAANAADGWPANYGGVMLQGFWWDSYDATKWATLTQNADELSQYFDLIWIPNAGSTSGDAWALAHQESHPEQMGYMPCYWLEKYETIFGTETELRTLISTYRQKGVGIIEDVVINHKNGVLSWCDFPDESVTVGGKTYAVTWPTDLSSICSNDESAWNNFSPQGNQDTGDNFDGCRDLDHTNAQVQANVKVYLDYLLNELGFAGFRYDMVKGYGAEYIGIYNNSANPTYSVGEYWDGQAAIQNWINGTGRTSAAFDFELKNKINTAFNTGDYNALIWKSFTADPAYSRYSITFAENHDTNRDGSELKYNWSAAEAFILTMPGTPCVYYRHYLADKTNIGAMCQARKAAGITNQSQIIKQEVTYDGRGYILETQGTNGTMYCQFGAQTNAGNPEGYTLVASGDSYKCYTSSSAPNREHTIYFQNTHNWGDFYCYAWDANNNLPLGAWPGTKVTNKTIDNDNYVTFTDVIPTGIIWHNNMGDDAYNKVQCTYEENRLYNADGATAYKYESPKTIYFDNVNKKDGAWSKVYCYIYHNNSEDKPNAWPGVELQKNNEGFYEAVVGNPWYDMVIFNNGSGGTGNQTTNLILQDGQVYTFCDGFHKDFAQLTPKKEATTTEAGNLAYYECQICGRKFSDANCSIELSAVETALEAYGDGTTRQWVISDNYIGEGNNLLFVNGNYTVGGNNVVKGGTCANLVVTDGFDFATPTTFTATHANYSRQMSYEWGTLCLPFGVSSNENVQFYELNNVASKIMTFDKLNEVAAGQPVAFKILSAKNDAGKFVLNLQSSGDVATASTTTNPIENWNMEGAFKTGSQQTDESGVIYFIAQNKFWKATVATESPAFRAWFKTTDTQSSANFRIEEDTDGISEIETDATDSAIYDLYGHAHCTLQEGFNLVNGKKVIIVK